MPWTDYAQLAQPVHSVGATGAHLADCAPWSGFELEHHKTTSVERAPEMYLSRGLAEFMSIASKQKTGNRRMDGFSPEGAQVGSCDDTGGASLRGESTVSRLRRIPTSLQEQNFEYSIELRRQSPSGYITRRRRVDVVANCRRGMDTPG